VTFFNTTNESGPTLAELVAKATSQEEIVRALFEVYPNLKASPFEVRRRVFSREVPITSVRRAMSNLATAGFLVRTEEKAVGEYGRSCYRWARRDQVPSDQLDLFGGLS
jgi:hypothetical protein